MLDSTALAGIDAEVLDWRFKAIPSAAHGLRLRDWLGGRPRLADLPTPLLTLDADAVRHNITAMAAWCAASGLSLAPHGKPTMAPQLWRRQLEAGAWGITVANPAQARVARAFGVPNLLVANEVVTPSVLTWLAEWSAAIPGRVVCFVDSVEAVAIMDDALRGTGESVEVCVELGGPGGRCGAIDADAAVRVADAVRRAPRLRLAGTAGYEGSLAHDVTETDLAVVDGFLAGLRDLHGRLEFETDEPIVSAGGSQYFDQVATTLGPLRAEGNRVLLRAGSYATHDDGLYHRVTPAARHRDGPELRPALRAYTTVLSIPEDGRAVTDAGRRDLPFDQGLPILLDHPGISVVDLNDQHAHLAGDVSGLAVGGVLRLGLSHPCTAMDKWNLIPMLDNEGTVVDAIRTYF